MASYEELFKKIEKSNPRLSLRADIVQAITKHSRRSRLFQSLTMGVCSFLSFLALVPATQFLFSEASSSGFSSYLNLMTTDGFSAFAAWRELLLSLAQSLPVMGVVAVLLSLVALLLSLRLTFGTSRPFFIRYA